MTMRLSDDVRDAKVAAAVARLDTGTGTAQLLIYSGAKPATVTGAPAGDLLAAFDLDATAFGAPSGGVAGAAGLPKTTQGLAAAGGGTAVGFARAVDKDGTARWDNDQVTSDGSGQINLNTTTISDGVDVTLNTWNYTQPAE